MGLAFATATERQGCLKPQPFCKRLWFLKVFRLSCSLVPLLAEGLVSYTKRPRDCRLDPLCVARLELRTFTMFPPPFPEAKYGQSPPHISQSISIDCSPERQTWSGIQFTRSVGHSKSEEACSSCFRCKHHGVLAP